MRAHRLLARLLFVFTTAAAAQHPERHTITHEDVFLMRRVGAPVVSPDGKWTAKESRAKCGGLMTHGAVVAREYGIPAVVSVAGRRSGSARGSGSASRLGFVEIGV